MSIAAAWPAPLAEMRPDQRTFALALGASLLAHAVVLSIHFRLPDMIDKAKERALDVILVNSKGRHKPVDAQAKAQANLDGGGNVDEDRRVATPLPPSVRERPGDSLLEAQERVAQLEMQTRQMMTQLRGERSIAADRSRNEPTPAARPQISGLDLASSAREMIRLEGEINRQTEEYNKRPRKKFLGARVTEANYAQYVEDWRQKVERIGNLNYPEAAKGKLSGTLVLTVSIKSDGSLNSVEVDHSSGFKVLDDAARRTVQLAAPYGRFPDSISRDTDILYITRRWAYTISDQFRSD